MATTPTVSTPVSLTSGSFPTLAAGTYCVSAAYPCNTNKPWDVIVSVSCATAGTVSGNKQVVVFVQESLDGTNYRTGPTSSTITTDEPNLRLLGTVPMNSTTTSQMGTFSVAQALGYLPFAFKVVTKNDLGVLLSSGSIFTSEISG